MGSNLWLRIVALEQLIRRLTQQVQALEQKLRVAEQNQYQQRGA